MWFSFSSLLLILCLFVLFVIYFVIICYLFVFVFILALGHFHLAVSLYFFFFLAIHFPLWLARYVFLVLFHHFYLYCFSWFILCLLFLCIDDWLLTRYLSYIQYPFLITVNNTCVSVYLLSSVINIFFSFPSYPVSHLYLVQGIFFVSFVFVLIYQIRYVFLALLCPLFLNQRFLSILWIYFYPRVTISISFIPHSIHIQFPS